MKKFGHGGGKQLHEKKEDDEDNPTLGPLKNQSKEHGEQSK